LFPRIENLEKFHKAEHLEFDIEGKDFTRFMELRRWNFCGKKIF